jgi:multidrug efflux pump subunit AcrB
MRLPEIGVHRPVATAMFFIAIVVMGLVSLTQLAIDMMPNI